VERLAAKVLLYMSPQLRVVHDGLALRLGVDLPSCARLVSETGDVLAARAGALGSDVDCDPEGAWRALVSALGNRADAAIRCMILAEAMFETARWHAIGALKALPRVSALVRSLIGIDAKSALRAFESALRSRCYARLKEWYIERLRRERGEEEG
jgi:hypothetical protein